MPAGRISCWHFFCSFVKMMNKTLILLLLFIFNAATLEGQDINAFSDVNNRLYQFIEGSFQQIYYQRTKDVLVGNQYVAYIDSKGDVYVHYKAEKFMVAQTYNEIAVTDNLLFVKTNNVLRVFDQGIKHILSSNAMVYGYNDSLVVFQDNIGGYLKYYWKDEIHEISMVVGTYPLLDGEVGANVFIYKDIAGNNSIFWHGKFYPLFSSSYTTRFNCGQDVAAFNDPQSQTFAVFDNGEVIDAEPQQAIQYKCGNNFVYYQDGTETHKVYQNEKVYDLGFDLQNIDVTDSIVIFEDVGISKVWYDGETYRIYNSKIRDYQVDGGIVAWPNQWGGINAFVRGKEVEITRAKILDFKLAGSTIVLKFGPSSYKVWWNGRMYDFTS